MPSEELQQFAQQIRAQRAAAPPSEVDLETRRRGMDEMAPPAPDDVTVTSVDAAGVPADWVCAPGVDADRRVLYLHGGGYILGSRLSHRRLASDVSRATVCAVLLIDYRLAPETPFPGAVDDALAALRWLRANGPAGPSKATALYVAGDSAGGGLTLATVLAARDAGDPLPDAAITLSAWTDLAGTGASLTTRAEADPLIAGGGEALTGMARNYLGDADPTTPLASPLYADLRGLPPLLMQVGDDEVLLDDTLRVAERAREQGVAVTVAVEMGAFHVYPLFAPDVPESKAALAQIGAFVRKHAPAAELRPA
jgi:acetyl esterase/lipase